MASRWTSSTSCLNRTASRTVTRHKTGLALSTSPTVRALKPTWRKWLRRRTTTTIRCLSGECIDIDVETASNYVSEEGAIDMVFQFEHMQVDMDDRWLSPAEFELTDLKQVLSRWQTELDGWNSLYLTNHDQPRIVSRFGHDGEYRRKSGLPRPLLTPGQECQPRRFSTELRNCFHQCRERTNAPYLRLRREFTVSF